MSLYSSTPSLTSLSISINVKDIAEKERFEKANSVFSSLADAVEKHENSAHSPPGKTVVVRRTFSMAEYDSANLDTLQKGAGAKGVLLTASDICRIALNAISGYSADEVIAAAQSLERLKPGRQA